MILGTLIGVISVALLLLAFALCAIAKQADEASENLERRLRDIAKNPVHPGEVIQFRRVLR